MRFGESLGADSPPILKTSALVKRERLDVGMCVVGEKLQRDGGKFASASKVEEMVCETQSGTGDVLLRR